MTNKYIIVNKSSQPDYLIFRYINDYISIIKHDCLSFKAFEAINGSNKIKVSIKKNNASTTIKIEDL